MCLLYIGYFTATIQEMLWGDRRSASRPHGGEGIFQYAIALKIYIKQLSTASRQNRRITATKGIVMAQFHCVSLALGIWMKSDWRGALTKAVKTRWSENMVPPNFLMATDTSLGGSRIAVETGIPQSNLKPISPRIKYLNLFFFLHYNCFVFVYGLYVKSLMAALATRTITEAGKITEDLEFHICHLEKKNYSSQFYDGGVRRKILIPAHYGSGTCSQKGKTIKRML